MLLVTGAMRCLFTNVVSVSKVSAVMMSVLLVFSVDNFTLCNIFPPSMKMNEFWFVFSCCCFEESPEGKFGSHHFENLGLLCC